MLQKLLPPAGVAAEFEDRSLRVGTVRLPDARMVCLFNWDDQPRPAALSLEGAANVMDYWTDQSLGRQQGTMTFELAPRSARLTRIWH